MPELDAGEGFLPGRNAVIVCVGDSITEAHDGYVAVLRNLIAAGYPERNIKVVNAGVSGNKAPDMLARLERDVLPHHPQWITISVGINDVWHGFYDFDGDKEIPEGGGPNGVPVDVYESTLNRMVGVLRESTDARIVLLTPTVIGEDLDNPANTANRRLADYVAAMQRVAAAQDTYLAPVHRDFVQALRAGKSVDPEYTLTTDGVHMNAIGNHVMALTILATLGFAGLAG